MKTTETFRDILWVLFPVVFVTVGLLIKADPSILSFKTPGSFEYIRKGERLFEKGRYKEAIRLYEKALRSSPDSDLIKAHAIRLYTLYAQDLQGAGKYAEAIYYLTEAYRLMTNDVTIRNLAMACARRGIFETRRGDLRRAVASFARSREVAAEGSVATEEQLAIVIYNNAVIAYRAGREEEAVFLLHESLLVGESARAYEVLGDIHYRASRLDDVAFYWQRALMLDPANPALAGKAGRITRERALAANGKRAELERFDVRLDDNAVADLVTVSAALDRAYREVGRELRHYPEDRTAVYLYNEDEFRDLFKLPLAVRAFYDGNIRMPLPQAAGADEAFETYIRHEYAHALVSALTDGRCPVWFSEGVAVYLQFGGDEAAAARAKDALAAVEEPGRYTLDDLEAAFRDREMGHDSLGLYYLLSYSVVDYIAGRFGMKAVRGILARVRQGQHVVNAIDDELLMSQQEFERRWHERVTGRGG